MTSLEKGQSRLDVRKYSFSQRTVNEWNEMSADCVSEYCMRPLWQLCLSELLQDVIMYCIMPATRSPELFMFDSIVNMSSWIVQLAVFTALFCVVCRREMLDTPVNMDNAGSC